MIDFANLVGVAASPAGHDVDVVPAGASGRVGLQHLVPVEAAVAAQRLGHVDLRHVDQHRLQLHLSLGRQQAAAHKQQSGQNHGIC